jgi:hypothetical protein
MRSSNATPLGSNRLVILLLLTYFDLPEVLENDRAAVILREHQNEDRPRAKASIPQNIQHAVGGLFFVVHRGDDVALLVPIDEDVAG